jgi:hypothetical protein
VPFGAENVNGSLPSTAASRPRSTDKLTSLQRLSGSLLAAV